ncbi:unnamed protein product [Lactuca virosa]|uniref:Uncharacterized protein n=1 Tax=Lactuca virosa TaxID=75947 RepID=A0AAU9LK06_9ASTR|nr:unnamed protein product [Lactuca virosa]
MKLNIYLKMKNQPCNIGPTIGRTQEIYSGEHEAEKGSRGNVIFWQRNLNKAYNDNISKINCNFCLWISQIVEGIMAPKM